MQFFFHLEKVAQFSIPDQMNFKLPIIIRELHKTAFYFLD